MASLNPAFILGVIVVAYLSSFVIFAILQILTGISIQRIGYFSIRRLKYSPKVGTEIEIRGLGLNLHWPTFAQPTWLSIVLTELAITVDLKATEGEKIQNIEPIDNLKEGSIKQSEKQHLNESNETFRSKTWKRLTIIKERLKRLHRIINWIRFVDLVATNLNLSLVDVGTIQVGNCTMAVDTRRKMMGRGRIFPRLKASVEEKRPAEWIITVRSVLFTADGGDSVEILDHSTLNINGLLYKEVDGLRDASISLKLGRVHIPYDDVNKCIDRYQSCIKNFDIDKSSATPKTSITHQIEETEKEKPEEDLLQALYDSKGLISSILRGIKEVQFVASFVGFTKRITSVQQNCAPIYLNASMKEVGIDLHRLDQKSPAHRMYFSSKDIAHQALVAALSISISLDDGDGKTERLTYIPMATTTMRTTFPSKTVEFSAGDTVDERNANILFANMVITSPSVDLEPKHLALISSMVVSKPRPMEKLVESRRYGLISWLLPKANVKFSIHEPVLRIALPPVEDKADNDDFDLIISSISSISLDIESLHSAIGDLHYILSSSIRLQSHALYYQTSSGAHHELLETESLELKTQIRAKSELYVAATGILKTFSIHMIRPEITDGVRQIVHQLRLDTEPKCETFTRNNHATNYIRALPSWLVRFSMQGTDFSAEVAGVDNKISDQTQGFALQLDSWSAEYHVPKIETNEKKATRRRAISRSLAPDTEAILGMPMPQHYDKKKLQSPNSTDGRKLSIQVKGLEAFIIESSQKWELDPFIAMPKFEFIFSTNSDNHGPVLDVTWYIKSLLIHYSLYRHYACGVAFTILRRAFLRTNADNHEAKKVQVNAKKLRIKDFIFPQASQKFFHQDSSFYPFSAKERVYVHLNATLFQVKAQMPEDPAIMLQIYNMEAGQNKQKYPFINASFGRLFAEASKISRVWARIASIKSLRINLRNISREERNGKIKIGDSIDINTEAIRLAIPHELVVHKVVDNLINTLKSVQQLHYRFVSGTKEPSPEKCSEGPKSLPKVFIRSKALLFELEDGAFEWKLGVIYRTGLVEQGQRLARQAAFDVKIRKIEEEMLRNSGKHRYKSVFPRERTKRSDLDRPRSRSEDCTSLRSHWSQSTQSCKIRYNPDGICQITSSAKIKVSEAYEKFQIYNSQSWKQRIDHAFNKIKANVKEHRGEFDGFDELPEDVTSAEQILQIPQRPSLMGILISDLNIKIDKPSFPLSKLPNFINRIGKGMPYDMQYAFLVPMHVQIDMGEARVTLRDYPLPLIHVPAIKPNQSPRLPALSLKANFAIAEEFHGSESTSHVKINIVAPNSCQDRASRNGRFAIDVQRTISPLKSYSDIKIDVNTGYPTRITWGSSFQPAIQDMMMIFETFTKPQIDPSDHVGFWDKIRLSFHSRVSVAWKRDGDVHLLLKGSRDPYSITGNGAGFLMCWRDNVRWDIRRDDDPQKFMTVQSGEYILAIPDLSHQVRNMFKINSDDSSISDSTNYKHGAEFKKVVMKLSGNVQWLAGLMFERNLVEYGQRSFEFKPHYNITLKRPDCAKSTDGLPYDAFRGFRSNHIHLSVAVKAPLDREFPIPNIEKLVSYNTVHLSPRFFSHFFAWWSMFGGTVSLPIRQGPLWPGVEKSSKKFARHIATIKYNILLAPLFISHIYKHNDAADYSKNADSATGLKIKLDNFMLDVHQRREELLTHDKSYKTQKKTSGMKMHQAQLDLISADIRAITASIPEINSDGASPTADSSLAFQNEEKIPDLSHFDIPGNDMSWIDMDDFVELDWILPSDSTPETKILPLAYAPRITYLRQTDHKETVQGNLEIINPFGHEPTHFCKMSKDDDPLWVQYELVKSRKKQLEKQLKSQSLALSDAQIRVAQDNRNDILKAEVEKLKKHNHFLRDKNQFLESMMQRIAACIHKSTSIVQSTDEPLTRSDEDPSKNRGSKAENINTEPLAEFRSDFNNRFIIHNMQLKWNNLLRNIILRYIHQVSQRRGIVYYLSRRAVKFILDIVEEQNKPRDFSKDQSHPKNRSSSPSFTSGQSYDPVYQDFKDCRNEIRSNSNKFTKTDQGSSICNIDQESSTENLSSYISGEFLSMNSYQLHLIAPQIQLQSEKNPMAVVLVTAKGMEAKVLEVMDKDRIYDNVSGLVQRRFSVEMDSMQFFVTHQNWFSSQLLSMYSGNRYGAPVGSAWPPWVPMEVMFDFKMDPFGFKRVVQKTSASLRYNKYNTLRLKYNNEISRESGSENELKSSKESCMDQVWVEFPRIHAICNSSQYYAMYIIVMDLLMYSEPQEKTRNERLEKIILASDFSDLRGVPEMIIRLQERIRRLEELKTYFQINYKYLDERSSVDRLLLDKDLSNCANELFFLMKAITTSQRKYDASKTSGLLRWNISSQQIVWHLIRDNNEPLLEFQLQRAEYDRTDNSDGSHINHVKVGKIIGLNLLPDAIYPEIFAPYSDVEGKTFNGDGQQTMLHVYWHMLEAIAGIPVMDRFVVKLVPMKIQLERDIGKRLFDYIFPGSSDNKNMSPFMVKNMQPIYDRRDETENHVSDPYFQSEDFMNQSTIDPGIGAETSLLRLKPTMNSEQSQKSSCKMITSFAYSPDENHSHIFESHYKSLPNPRNASKKQIKPPSNIRQPLSRSMTTDFQPTIMTDSKGKRFSIGRHNSKLKNEQSSDDLTKMMGRASSYMTLVHVQIPSVVLCLSYKGKGERNFEDIHDLVFRLPDIEYRNKTWSNLDLALAFKRDVIKSLISHMGAIVANKFKHRPNIAHQHRQRELATNSMVLAPSSQETSYENSDATSSLDISLKAISRSEKSCRSSQSIKSSQICIQRTPSHSSRLSNTKSLPVGLLMTSMEEDGHNQGDKTVNKKSNVKSGVLGRLRKKSDTASSSVTGKNFQRGTEDKRRNFEGGDKKNRRSLKIILGNGSG